MMRRQGTGSVGGDGVGAGVLALEGRVGLAEDAAGDAVDAVGDAAAVSADDVVGHVLVGGGREPEVMEVVVGAEVVQVVPVYVDAGLGHAGAVVGAVECFGDVAAGEVTGRGCGARRRRRTLLRA